MIYDIIIVGAGPAGLTAAIYARRSNKSVLLLDKASFGGQITFSPKVENYPGFESISGSKLADLMVEQALALGTEIEIEEVTGLRINGDTKKVMADEGNEYECKAVILACGAKHRHLGVKNEEKFIGNGISFCAVCDGAFYRGKTVALIGGGNSALQEAVLLSEGCEKIYIIQNLDFLTGEKQLQDILKEKDNVEIITGTVVSEIDDTPEFSGITVEHVSDGVKTHFKLDGMFIAIGLEPENTLFADIADLDDKGYFNSGEDCLTKTPGIFVAGDCRKKSVRQVATASADGAISAVTACRYIDGY